MAVIDLGCKIVATPNNSSSTKENMFLLLAIATVSLLIALCFARIGAWLVLPFAGLEVLAFAYVFNYIFLHSTDFESISVEHERVIIEKRKDKEVTKTEFPRHWAQVSVRNNESNGLFGSKNALFISSHGKEVEFGESLINDEQRVLLAQAIKQKLKNID